MEIRGEVLANEPSHRFAYRITEGPLNARNEYVISPEGDGTAFRMSERRGNGGRHHAPCRSPYSEGLHPHETRKEVERLKQLLE